MSARPGGGRSPRRAIVGGAVLVVALFLVLPLLVVLAEAFAHGLGAYADAVAQPTTRSAIRLTLVTALFAVVLNLGFGLAAAWCIAKFEFRGKRLLLALVDLPFAVSPVIAGLVFVLLFGAHGWIGPWLLAHGVRVIFALPGMVLVTVFVTVPFVVRELVPLMEAQGAEEEEAAVVLGASGWQTFRRITLPNVRWALLYGVILCNARAMGEFGAVSVVSGHVQGGTTTLPLQIEILYDDYDFTAAFAAASILAALALVTLAAKSWLERREPDPGAGDAR
jgi:sulfate/thiosulfate transport system permease protein